MTTRDPDSSSSSSSLATLRRQLDPKIAECRAATKAYRDAFTLADLLTQELKALGVCGQCCVSEHYQCRDYGCVCCGGGK